MDFAILAFCVFLMVKMMNKLMKKKQEAAPAPVPEPSKPVLFGRDYFTALLHLPEGSGGSAVLRAHPQAIRLLPTPAAELRDIDTRSDLEALRGGKG